MGSPAWISELSVGDRIERAKEFTKLLSYELDGILQLNETNSIIQYSDVVSRRVPKSQGEFCFLNVRDALFRYQILRLVALWDNAQKNHFSIPTVIELISDDMVLEALIESAGGRRRIAPEDQSFSAPDKDTLSDLREWAKKLEEKSVADTEYQALDELLRTIDAARAFKEDNGQERARNFRNHLAHLLVKTIGEIKAEANGFTIEPLKYGDEKSILEISVPVVEKLYCWVNGISYSHASIQAICRKRAEDFWHRIRFADSE